MKKVEKKSLIDTKHYNQNVVNFFDKDKIFFEFHYIDDEILSNSCCREEEPRYNMIPLKDYDEYEKYIFVKFLYNQIKQQLEEDEQQDTFFAYENLSNSFFVHGGKFMDIKNVVNF